LERYVCTYMNSMFGDFFLQAPGSNFERVYAHLHTRTYMYMYMHAQKHAYMYA
jgi:hypothetical protein